MFPAALFRLGAVQGFPVSFFVTSFFENGSKKTVNFSHIATSQRSVFGYSVFSNLPAANGLSKPFADASPQGISAFVTKHSRSGKPQLLSKTPPMNRHPIPYPIEIAISGAGIFS